MKDVDIVSDAQMHVVLTSLDNEENSLLMVGDAMVLFEASGVGSFVKYLEFTHFEGKGEYEHYVRPGNIRMFFDPMAGVGVMLDNEIPSLNLLWALTRSKIHGDPMAENDDSSLSINWENHTLIHMPYNREPTVSQFTGKVELVGRNEIGNTVGYDITPKG
jgi:hypothetical protein